MSALCQNRTVAIFLGSRRSRLPVDILRTVRRVASQFQFAANHFDRHGTFNSNSLNSAFVN